MIPTEIVPDAIEWDHDRLHRLERTALDAWAAGDSRAAEAAFALFAHGLRRHIGFEEALYPAADRVLTSAERGELIRRVQLFHGG